MVVFVVVVMVVVVVVVVCCWLLVVDCWLFVFWFWAVRGGALGEALGEACKGRDQEASKQDVGRAALTSGALWQGLSKRRAVCNSFMHGASWDLPSSQLL